MCGGNVIHFAQLVNLLFSRDMLGLGLGMKVQSPCPKDREQVTHPYEIQHPEEWSQTLWSCARQKFESSTAKSESSHKPSLQCCATFFVMNARALSSVCHMSGSILWSIANFFTNRRQSSRTIRAKYKIFQDNLRAYFWQFSNWFEFFLLELMIIQAKAWNCFEVAPLSCVPIHSIARRIIEDVLPVVATNNYLLLQQKYVIQTSLKFLR